MLISNITFCRAAFRDPGIIPKVSDRTYSEMLKFNSQKPQENRALNDWDKIWYFSRTQGFGHSVQILYPLEFCKACLIYKPPRAEHCAICDNCILGFDHHCIWLGNCVGNGNYIDFMLFILILLIGIAIQISRIAYLHVLMLKIDNLEMGHFTYTGPVSIGILAIIFILILILFVYHLRLI